MTWVEGLRSTLGKWITISDMQIDVSTHQHGLFLYGENDLRAVRKNRGNNF